MKLVVQKLNHFLVLASLVLVSLISLSRVFAAETLQIVPTEKVCMVTNMVFPKTQIPVTHGGKTYYGCCENCKKTLSEDAASRFAIDPVSGKKIDKATAVIAARDDGSVIYFENKKTFDKYNNSSKK